MQNIMQIAFAKQIEMDEQGVKIAYIPYFTVLLW